MDFSPVPPNTTPAQALQLRGPDPDLFVAAADSYITTLGDALEVQTPPVAGQRCVPYSRGAGAQAGMLFTRDPAVLARFAHGAVVAPLKLRAHWLRLIADGIPDTAALALHEFHAACESLLGGLDYSNLHADYLVTHADLFDTHPGSVRRRLC